MYPPPLMGQTGLDEDDDEEHCTGVDWHMNPYCK